MYSRSKEKFAPDESYVHCSSGSHLAAPSAVTNENHTHLYLSQRERLRKMVFLVFLVCGEFPFPMVQLRHRLPPGNPEAFRDCHISFSPGDAAFCCTIVFRNIREVSRRSMQSSTLHTEFGNVFFLLPTHNVYQLRWRSLRRRWISPCSWCTSSS